MKRIAIAFGSIALLLACSALGQQASPSASIEGFVVEAGSNRPLPKSSLQLRSLDDPSQRYPGLSGDGGRFVFQKIPAGRYTLIASHNGYMHAEYRQRGPNSGGEPLVVGQNEPVSGIRLTMTPSTAISGHVFGPNGRPAAYVQVQALRLSYPGGQRRLTVTSSTVTDDLGGYRLYGLPAGQYVLSAQTNPASLGIMPVLASSTPPLPGVVMFQSASGPMQFDADPANQNLRMNPSLLTYFPGVTDDREARVFDLRPGDDLAAVDTVMIVVKPVAVSGTVSGVAPNVTATVTFTTPNGTGVPQNPSGTTTIPIRGEGSFTASLPPGSYTAVASSRSATGSSIGYTTFEVRPGNTPPINLTLAPSIPVTGRIAIEGVAGNLPDLSKVRVLLNRTTPLSASNNPNAFQTRPDGTLSTLPNVVEGDYEVTIASGQTGPAPRLVRGLVAGEQVLQGNASDQSVPENLRSLYVKSIRATNAEAGEGRIRIPARPSGPIQLEIVLAAGSELSGIVRNAAGEPQSNVTAVLVPEQQDRQSLYKNVMTDGEGRFRFEGVAPGAYRAFSWEDVQVDDWRNPAFVNAYKDRGKAIGIGEDRTGADITMIPARE